MSKAEAKAPDAISENSSLCLFFQLKNNASGPTELARSSLNF